MPEVRNAFLWQLAQVALPPPGRDIDLVRLISDVCLIKLVRFGSPGCANQLMDLLQRKQPCRLYSAQDVLFDYKYPMHACFS